MPKHRVVRHEVIQPLDQSYRLIPLTQGQNAIVDVEDFEWLSQWNWFAQWSPTNKNFYAMRPPTKSEDLVRMHRLVIGCRTKECDHVNHNTLDNRKSNLRPCTKAQNAKNRRPNRTAYSCYKGARFHKASQKWRATIGVNRHQLWLGLYSSKEEAAKAYDDAAKKYHKDFAALNFPD